MYLFVNLFNDYYWLGCVHHGTCELCLQLSSLSTIVAKVASAILQADCSMENPHQEPIYFSW